jgi:uncharacterized membrane protein
MDEKYEDVASGPDEISDDDRLWAALAWVPVLWPIIAILLLLMPEKKARPFINYNVVMALVTGVVGVALSAVCIGVIVFLAMFYYAYLAYQGQRVVVPVLTQFAENQGWV